MKRSPRSHIPGFQQLVSDELITARLKYKPFNSLHEGYATLLEEVEELWDEIKKKPTARDRKKLLREAVQVGAMIQRLVEDMKLV